MCIANFFLCKAITTVCAGKMRFEMKRFAWWNSKSQSFVTRPVNDQCPHSLKDTTFTIMYRPPINDNLTPLMEEFAKTYNFRNKYVTLNPTLYNNEVISWNKIWTLSYLQIFLQFQRERRTIDLYLAAFLILEDPYNSPLNFTTPIDKTEVILLSRSPLIIQKYDQHFKTFTPSVWIATLVTLILMSLMLGLTHYVYCSQIDPKWGLAGHVTHKLDFLILSVSSITEPDSLPWFPKASSGLNIFLTNNIRIW